MRTTAGITILTYLTLSTAPAPALGQPAPLQTLDRYIEAAVAAWNVPALAIAIVKDDRVVHARGYGELAPGITGQRVTENTIFGAGSTTKAFTAAALAILVDEGRLAWDDKVVDHLKDFRMYDPYVTANITVRDLLSHTSGLTPGDRMWYTRSFERKEVVRRVRYQEPSWSFRGRFGYSNTMYTAAGLVVEAIAGQTWDEFLKKRIFDPLGMNRTTTTIAGIERLGNVSSPYTSVDGKPAAIPRWNQDNIGPAGSINSTANDYAQWIRLQLGNGSYGGRKLISPERMGDMHEAQTVIRGPTSPLEPPTMFNTYGLGWFLREYEGRKLASHGGGGHGVAALVALLPQEKLGIAVLTNMDGHSLPTALVYQILDAYLKVPDRDWSKRYLADRDSSLARARRQQQEVAAARVQGTKPTLPLDAYVGTYWHPYYDSATVWRKGEQLYFRFVSDMQGPLEHWHYDTFRANWEHPRYGRNFVTFRLKTNGEIDAIRVPAEWDPSVLVDLTKVTAVEKAH